MSMGRRALLGVAGMSAAVLVGGSYAWACTDLSLTAGATEYPEGVGAPAAPAIPATATAEPTQAPVAATPAPVAAPVPAPATATPAPVRRGTTTAAATPAPAPVAPAPVVAAAPAPAVAPAAPAAALTSDAWSGFETSRTAANTPAAPAESRDSGSGQFGLGLALLGAGVATLAAGGVVASRRRTVKAAAE